MSSVEPREGVAGKMSDCLTRVQKCLKLRMILVHRNDWEKIGIPKG